jgi:glycosyltransferase involved in cell wall biosynthesis
LFYGLQSLYALEKDFEYEILVINEYIDDVSKDIAKRFRARYLHTRPNDTINTIKWRVPGLAINYGVKQAKGNIVVITCPEILHIDLKQLRRMVDTLTSNQNAVAYTDGLDDRVGLVLKDLKDGKSLGWVQRGHKSLADLNTKFPFFMGIRKEDFIRIGGYEEEFQKGFAFDDTNFSRRLEVNEFKFIQVPGMIVHLYHQRLRYGLPEVQIPWQRNKELYERLYDSRVANIGKEWGNL